MEKLLKTEKTTTFTLLEKPFVWRGELTKKIGREVLSCEKDVL